MPIPNQTALVASIKADLIARRVIPNPQQDNGDSFQITGRVAWALRNQGAKLIRKSASQNGWTIEEGPLKGVRVSHDAIAFSDGWVDVLTSAGPPANANGPTWQWNNSAPPPAGTVADPFDLDALEPPAEPDPPDEPEEPGTVPMPDLIAIINAAVTTALAKEFDAFEMDFQALAADVEEIKRVQALGLSGTLFGYRVTLTPPTKGNGKG